MSSEKPVAIVTGASRGIGKTIAIEMARAGYNIAGIARSESSAKGPEEEIKALGAEYLPLAVDVSSEEAVNAAVDTVTKEFDRIDVLINNAGITKDGLMMRMPTEDWNAVIQTNLNSAFYFIRAVSRSMMRARKGRIINISSVIGQHGNAGQANYAAAKAGMNGLTKSIAKEFGSRGITCNAICPGFIHTDMTDELNEEMRKKIEEQVPLRRLGNTTDIAALAVFLSGEHAGYITGQEITVDGGLFV